MAAQGSRCGASVRSVAVTVLVCVLVAALLAGEPGPARADVGSDIAAAKSRLAALQDDTERISEQYNRAQLALDAARRTADGARRQADRAQQALRRQRDDVRRLARSIYMGAGQGTFRALVGAGDPGTFLEQATTLDVVAGHRADAVAALRAATKAARDATQTADSAAADALRVAAAATAEREAIVAAVSRQEQVLAHLQQVQAQLVAQARAALAAALARQRAEAAAALARAQAEQQALAAQRAAVASSAPGDQAAPTAIAPDVAPPSGDAAATAIAWARRELGKPYVYGAAGPDSFDCSGLTMYVYGKAGISLPHYTGDQWNAGRHVTRDQLEPGDLVFFYSDLHHVGLYIGAGQMIDAPHSGATVEQVGVWWDLFQGGVRVT